MEPAHLDHHGAHHLPIYTAHQCCNQNKGLTSAVRRLELLDKPTCCTADSLMLQHACCPIHRHCLLDKWSSSKQCMQGMAMYKPKQYSLSVAREGHLNNGHGCVHAGVYLLHPNRRQKTSYCTVCAMLGCDLCMCRCETIHACNVSKL